MPLEILEKIEAAYKESLLKRNELRTSALRLIKAAIKNKEVSVRPKPFAEEHMIEALKSLTKQRIESIEAFDAAGRKDLADKERAELKIVEEFLPAQLSQEEVERKIVEYIAKLELKSPKDFGILMREVMVELKGKADGKLVSEIARKKLEESAS